MKNLQAMRGHVDTVESRGASTPLNVLKCLVLWRGGKGAWKGKASAARRAELVAAWKEHKGTDAELAAATKALPPPLPAEDSDSDESSSDSDEGDEGDEGEDDGDNLGEEGSDDDDDEGESGCGGRGAMDVAGYGDEEEGDDEDEEREEIPRCHKMLQCGEGRRGGLRLCNSEMDLITDESLQECDKCMREVPLGQSWWACTREECERDVCDECLCRNSKNERVQVCSHKCNPHLADMDSD